MNFHFLSQPSGLKSNLSMGSDSIKATYTQTESIFSKVYAGITFYSLAWMSLQIIRGYFYYDRPPEDDTQVPKAVSLNSYLESKNSLITIFNLCFYIPVFSSQICEKG